MTFEIDLPRELDSAAAARHAVDQLGDTLGDDQLGDVRLLVSELVTNSLRHAKLDENASIRLAVDVRDTVVRVEVCDTGPGFSPPTKPDDPESAEGWGLYLVATLADRWGVERDGVTLVWFELDRAPNSDSMAA